MAIDFRIILKEEKRAYAVQSSGIESLIKPTYRTVSVALRQICAWSSPTQFPAPFRICNLALCSMLLRAERQVDLF